MDQMLVAFKSTTVTVTDKDGNVRHAGLPTHVPWAHVFGSRSVIVRVGQNPSRAPTASASPQILDRTCPRVAEIAAMRERGRTERNRRMRAARCANGPR
jgi:hypothetical protein